MINNLRMKNILFLLLFVSSFSYGQKAPEVDLSNPRATVYTHVYFLQANSYKPENAAKTINGLDKEESIKAAIKIKRILDGKGLKVDFNVASFSSLTNARKLVFLKCFGLLSL